MLCGLDLQLTCNDARRKQKKRVLYARLPIQCPRKYLGQYIKVNHADLKREMEASESTTVERMHD